MRVGFIVAILLAIVALAYAQVNTTTVADQALDSVLDRLDEVQTKLASNTDSTWAVMGGQALAILSTLGHNKGLRRFVLRSKCCGRTAEISAGAATPKASPERTTAPVELAPVGGANV